MRARHAYISSLSTTAILVAAALLMLALLGAFVGFGHWPHSGGGGQVDPVGVGSASPRVTPAADVVRAPRPARRISAPRAPAARAATKSPRHVPPATVVVSSAQPSSAAAPTRVATTSAAAPASPPAVTLAASRPSTALVTTALDPLVAPVVGALPTVSGRIAKAQHDAGLDSTY